MPRSDLQKHIDRLVKQHGGLRAAARKIQIDPAYLWRLRQGRKSTPGDKVLEKLGLRRVERLLTYRG
jgi:hypothetical protein